MVRNTARARLACIWVSFVIFFLFIYFVLLADALTWGLTDKQQSIVCVVPLRMFCCQIRFGFSQYLRSGLVFRTWRDSNRFVLAAASHNWWIRFVAGSESLLRAAVSRKVSNHAREIFFVTAVLTGWRSMWRNLLFVRRLVELPKSINDSTCAKWNKTSPIPWYWKYMPNLANRS